MPIVDGRMSIAFSDRRWWFGGEMARTMYTRNAQQFERPTNFFHETP
jgi:hypothetical protein